MLGPLLFLVYINDISNSSDQLKFYLFADDTNLLYADKNLRELEIKVNTELSKIYDWLVANKLSLNIKLDPPWGYIALPVVRAAFQANCDWPTGRLRACKNKAKGN